MRNEPSPDERYPRAWLIVLGVGACAIAAYYLSMNGVAQDLLYSGIGVAASVVMVIAIQVRRPPERAGWYFLAVANACFVLGDGVYAVYDLVPHTDPPFPSVADALYLAGYPFLFAGVLRISRLRTGPGAKESRVDAAIVSVGTLALSWQFLMGSYAHDTTLGGFGKLVTMAYPVMDIGVVFIVCSAMMTQRAQRPADRLIAAAAGLMLIADFVYDVLVLHSNTSDPSPLDAGFLSAYILIAAAAIHPSASRPRPEADEGVRRRRLWLPLVALAGFVSPVIILISAIAGVQVDLAVLAGTTIVLFSLAVFRAILIFRRLNAQTDQLTERGESLQVALATQQELENDLRHQAFHDSLTGLANRALLHDRVAHALEASKRLNGTVAICFCDLDGFKGVNDSMGHQIGDQLLISVSKRLASIVRAGDTVARLGGDEFAILLENVEDFDLVMALADRIVSVLHEPTEISGHQINLSVSVGIAVAEPGTTTEILLSEADAAMYAAKASGKDRFAMFETIMRSRIVERMTILNSFQNSLTRREFFIEYQPQLRLADGALEGFEALARWRHPTLGLVGPGRFIPLAEETGFIVPLGRWVLEQACLEAAQWEAPNGVPLQVSVNLSGRQLHEPQLLGDVQTALAFSGLAPDRLILEITEGVLTVNQDEVRELLRRFKQMGIRIAIDDFGTGYCSLSYLRDFPVDILKIDKSFVDLLAEPASDGATFITTILRLADDLHLEATAEGIEHKVQRDALRALNCHSGQGYLMSRPLSAGAARGYIAEAGRSLEPAASVHRATLA